MVRAVSSRTVRAVLILESCALQVVLSPAGVEGGVGWMEDPRAGARQSVNKQIASLLNSGWASLGSRPAEGWWDAQGPRCCLLVLMLNCSDAHAGRQESGWKGMAGAGQGRFRGA